MLVHVVVVISKHCDGPKPVFFFFSHFFKTPGILSIARLFLFSYDALLLFVISLDDLWLSIIISGFYPFLFQYR